MNIKKLQTGIIAIALLIISNATILAAPQYIQMNLFPATVEFKIIDPLGRITGYDQALGIEIEQIPNSSYGYNEIPSTKDIPVTLFETFNEFISSGSNVGGEYQIICYGKGTTPYHFEIGVSWLPNEFSKTKGSGIADIGKIDTYQILLSDTFLGMPIITRIASPNSIIADINATHKLGFIGNSEFVQELIKKVQKIEKERTEPPEPEEQNKVKDQDDKHLTPAQKAQKRYQKLLKEITEKYQKPEPDEFVKQEAYTVLKEDLEYIIAHL